MILLFLLDAVKHISIIRRIQSCLDCAVMSHEQAHAPCCLGTVHQGELKGKQIELGPLTTYLTGDVSRGGRAVLIIPDVYGFSIPNTR